jgi:phage host-nuclease inhibitor protein Gam
MEARIARVESDVTHVLTHVADIKTDVRALRTRMDERIDRLETKFETKLDALEKKLDSRFVLALTLGVASVAGILGAMVRGFGWI